MVMGGGRYEDVVEKLYKDLKAEGLVLVVVSGLRGSSFGVKGTGRFCVRLPAMLRRMADQMDADLEGSTN